MRRRALVAALVLLFGSGCALLRDVTGPLFGWPWMPSATDDLDAASLAEAIANTAPLWERRGQEEQRNAAVALLAILQSTDDPGERLAAVEQVFDTHRVARHVLLTAYYEPELPARLSPDARFQHPLYARLTETPDPSGKAGRVRWNFEKFLVTPDDRVMRWRPTTEPDDPEIVAAIESELKALGR